MAIDTRGANEAVAAEAPVARELEHLVTVGRQEVAERLRRAIETGGNPTENGDLLAVLQEQDVLEYRIRLLERRLQAGDGEERGAAGPEPGVVGRGSRVRVELADGAAVAYEIVGTLEADAAAGRLSDRSPLGRAVLGRRTGDTVAVDAPGGRFWLRILAVEQPPSSPAGIAGSPA